MTDFLELLIWNLWPFGDVNMMSYAVLIVVCAIVAFVWGEAKTTPSKSP